MKIAITLTTINIPKVITSYCESINKLSSNNQYKFIIIGDKKTPNDTNEFIRKTEEDYSIPIQYFDFKNQERFNNNSSLWKHIPANSFARRNYADILAYYDDFDFILRIDDDNKPNDINYFNKLEGAITCNEFSVIESESGWYNICEQLDEENSNIFYARGFPYSRRWEPEKINISKIKAKISLLGGLWYGDPDIDAVTRIHRTINATKYKRSYGDYFILNHNTNSPINTQNTLYSSKLIPASFISPYAGRYDDIFSNYFLRAIMKHLNDYVAFGEPIVFQDRNIHNLWNDLENEIIGNRYCSEVLEALEDHKFKNNNYLDCLGEIPEVLKNIDFKVHNDFFQKIIEGINCWCDSFKDYKNI